MEPHGKAICVEEEQAVTMRESALKGIWYMLLEIFCGYHVHNIETELRETQVMIENDIYFVENCSIL